MIKAECPKCQKLVSVKLVRTVPIMQKWELSYGKRCYFCTVMAFCEKCGKYLGWK